MSGERDTREMMNVEAFSQLPFLRSSPAARDKISTPTAVRLFGIDFPHDASSSSDSSFSKENSNSTNALPIADKTIISGGGSGDEESSRKFECHYCYRNFPTSQALGGHQNAHKRERQQAKRAHLHSTVAAHYRNLYGVLNYQNLPPFGFPNYYPSRNTYPTSRTRFFNGDRVGTVSEPTTGSPVTAGGWGTGSSSSNTHVGIWPANTTGFYLNSTSVPSSVVESRVIEGKFGHGNGWSSSSSCSSSSSPFSLPLSTARQDNRPSVVCESATARVQEHVSLDLHL